MRDVSVTAQLKVLILYFLTNVNIKKKLSEYGKLIFYLLIKVLLIWVEIILGTEFLNRSFDNIEDGENYNVKDVACK